jgi:AraC-like DNA-binding protein
MLNDRVIPPLGNREIRTSNVVFGEHVYRPGGICGPRLQPDYQLLVLHSGACRVTVNESVYNLHPKSVYLFRPGGWELFRFAKEDESRHFWCSARPSILPGDLGKRLIHAPFATTWSDVFEALYATVAKLGAPQHRDALIDQLGLCFFSEFLAASEEENVQIDGTPAVRLFRDYVESHFGQPDCLEAAHRTAGISRNALICKFSKEMQLTPARYLWRLRIERGVAMLRETNLTIAKIAEQCGFKDQFHFSKQVKTCFGFPPKIIRHQFWYDTGVSKI